MVANSLISHRITSTNPAILPLRCCSHNFTNKFRQLKRHFNDNSLAQKHVLAHKGLARHQTSQFPLAPRVSFCSFTSWGHVIEILSSSFCKIIQYQKPLDLSTPIRQPATRNEFTLSGVEGWQSHSSIDYSLSTPYGMAKP